MLQTLGRLHPFLVHFPIALLLAALVAELRRPRAEGSSANRPNETAHFCLVLGTLGALAAAASGWLFARHDPPGLQVLLERHRWTGVGAAALALFTLGAAWRWRRSASARWARATRVGLGLTVLAALAAGALGGDMVYGEGFVLEPLRLKAAKVPARGAAALTPDVAAPPRESAPVPSPAPSSVEVTGSASEPAPVDYLTEIQPLFARRCYECHGDGKRPKGDLRLTDLAAVLARDPSEAALVPGAPEQSLVYQRLVLPADHEDLMPPEDGPLPAEEIELVRRWIQEGARWAPLANPSAEPEPVPAAASGPTLSATQRSERDAALARLRGRGVRAQRLASTSEEVEVDFGVAAEPCGDAELALLAGLEPCLVELSLARSRVSDAGLARLAGFHVLRRLRLEHTGVGDVGLAHLARLEALESLNLFGTRAGDAGLAALRDLPRLARLYVGETTLSEAALDEFARVRAELVIERGRLPAAEAPR